MPVTPTYPGVYIQEIPSGVRTITGVATSITAFLGRTRRGPVNEPVLVGSYADFERSFGGLWAKGPLSYAVRDFFLNGGAQAIVVRLFHGGATGGAQPADALDDLRKLLEAAGAAERLEDLYALLNEKRAEVRKAQFEADSKLRQAEAALASLTLEAQQKAAAAAALDAHLSNVADEAAVALRSLGTTAQPFIALSGQADAARTELAQARTDQATAQANLTKAQRSPDLTDARTGQTAARQSYTIALSAIDAIERATEGSPDIATARDRLTQRFYRNGALDDAKLRKLAAGAAVAPAGDRARLSFPGAFTLLAASAGEWGNQLQVSVDRQGIDMLAAASNPPLPAEQLFNLQVSDPGSGRTERLINLTIDEQSPRYIGSVLAQESALVRLDSATKPQGVPHPTPPDHPTTVQEGGSDGQPLTLADYLGDMARKEGMYALEKAGMFNMLCIPPDSQEGDTDPLVYQQALAYCVSRRAMLIVDPPVGWNPVQRTPDPTSIGLVGPDARNAAVFYPRLVQADPLREGQLAAFAPCGAVAGVIARTDGQRGVWKAPAGIDAALNGIQGLKANLTDSESGQLNPLGINCLRSFPAVGPVIWGARTMRGADQLADEYKYLPVRRLALFIEESLFRGMQWVVFEPNDEPLWAQIRLNVGAFMHNLFRQGAFQGQTPREAYLVRCDRETTTQNDINLGVVNVLVGFAPLKPAEFVIISLQQLAGQIQA